MAELCYFSLDQWEIKIHLLWGKCFNIPHWPKSHSTNGRLQHIEELSKSKTRVGMVWLKWLIVGTIDGVLVIFNNQSHINGNQHCESEWASLLPNAQQTRGLSALIKVVSLGHITITSCYTNLDQNSASASRRSSNFIISTRYQHQNIDQTPASKSRLNFNVKILTKSCGQSLNENLASKTWPNFPDYFKIARIILDYCFADLNVFKKNHTVSKPSWYFWII